MPRTLTVVALALICAAWSIAQVAEPIASGPPPVAELAAEAERLYDEWRWDELRAISLRMVTHYPESAESLYWRGVAHNREEENAEARVAYERALERDPDMLRARRDLVGLMWALDGKDAHLSAARDLADTCAEIIADDPDNRDAHWTRAWALNWLDDFAGAREELGQVVEADPADAEALRDLGRFATYAGDLDAAVGFYERAVEAQPNDMGALVGLVRLYSMDEQRQYDALALAERMKRINPMAPEAYQIAGLTLGLRLNELDAALEQLDIVLVLDPVTAARWSAKADLLRISGDPDAALAVLDEAVEAGIDPDELHLARANCYHDMGHAEEAVAEYSAAIEQRPNSAVAYLRRAEVYIELERWEKAWSDLHRAQDLGTPERLFEALAEQLREHMPEPEREGG